MKMKSGGMAEVNSIKCVGFSLNEKDFVAFGMVSEDLRKNAFCIYCPKNMFFVVETCARGMQEWFVATMGRMHVSMQHALLLP